VLFFVDNMLPRDLVYALRNAGHEARHTSRLGRVSSNDGGIWVEACAKRATVLTKDKDFIAMATPHEDARVILVRFGNLGTSATISRIMLKLPEILPHLITEPVAYLD
jgi:predicted nuclease of predicted toxin-antitoxin system